MDVARGTGVATGAVEEVDRGVGAAATAPARSQGFGGEGIVDSVKEEGEMVCGVEMDDGEKAKTNSSPTAAFPYPTSDSPSAHGFCR